MAVDPTTPTPFTFTFTFYSHPQPHFIYGIPRSSPSSFPSPLSLHSPLSLLPQLPQPRPTTHHLHFPLLPLPFLLFSFLLPPLRLPSLSPHPQLPHLELKPPQLLKHLDRRWRGLVWCWWCLGWWRLWRRHFRERKLRVTRLRKKKRVKYRRRERERESEREREEKKLTERLQHTYQITHQNGGLRLHGRRPSPSSRRENGVKPANSGDADKDADKDANADAGGVVLLHVRARACGVGPYKETTC